MLARRAEGMGPIAGGAVPQCRTHRKPRIALLGWSVAGNRTHYESIRDVAARRADLRVRAIPVQAFKRGGMIEALPLPRTIRGQLRAVTEAALAYLPGAYDAVWTSCTVPAMPVMFNRRLFGAPTLVMTMDATPVQLAQMATHYPTVGRGSRGWHRRAVAALYRAADVLNPWSEWAASSLMREYRVRRERVHVIPPGVDLSRWRVGDADTAPDRPVRLLFVGGDFERKGGDLLLNLFHHALSDRCELHMVTSADVPDGDGVHVYRGFAPNDPALRALYARSDLLVLPTRADCFSLASIEAMACGVPVVTTPVGGIPEIVLDGTTGTLVPVNDARALRGAIEQLIVTPERRMQMGRAARARVEQRFDADVNVRRLLSLIVESGARRNPRQRVSDSLS